VKGIQKSVKKELEFKKKIIMSLKQMIKERLGGANEVVMQEGCVRKANYGATSQQGES